MLVLSMFLGVLLLLGIPIVGFSLVIWYGLNNPETGAGKWVYKWWPFGMPESVRSRERERDDQISTELRQVTHRESMENRLRKVHLGQFLVLLGDQLDVVGIITLLELQFFGADKSVKVHVSPGGDKLREFPWFTLGDGRVITELPNGEGKHLAWYIGDDLTETADVAVSEFMSGPINGPAGPAKRFAQSNQSAHVEFTIPGVSGSWRCIDIVWADCRIQGENVVDDNSRLAMVLSRQEDGEDYLLFCDLRSGRGSDTLWRLRPINLEAEIEDIL